MATLRIRFVATGGALTAAIRAAQLGYPFTHVDAALPEGWLGAHLDGVRLRPPGYDAGPRTRERWYALDATAEQASAFAGFLRAQIGKPYDHGVANDLAWSALAGEGATQPPGTWRAPERWFCSELVAAGLVEAGLLAGHLADEVRHVTPQCLAFAVAALGRLVDPPAERG